MTTKFQILKLPEINIDGDLTTIAAVKGNFYPGTGEIFTFQGFKYLVRGLCDLK